MKDSKIKGPYRTLGVTLEFDDIQFLENRKTKHSMSAFLRNIIIDWIDNQKEESKTVEILKKKWFEGIKKNENYIPFIPLTKKTSEKLSLRNSEESSSHDTNGN